MTTGQPCLVVFHAHPDDEAIFTGGAIIRAKRAGWRVVVAFATSGERGTKPDWVIDDLAAHRRIEAKTSARILGADDVVFLGYEDSGAEPTTSAASRAAAFPDVPALASASVLEVAERLRRILAQERATALTSYDELGVYGHRDHVRVHTAAASAVVGTACDLIEATVNRRHLRSLRSHLVARGLEPEIWPAELVDRIGTEDDPCLITLDVGSDLDRKLEAVAAHASQMVEAHHFMGLPPGAFHRLMATECFRPSRVLDGRFCEVVTAG